MVAALSFLVVGWASAVAEIVVQERSPHIAKEVQYGEASVYEPATRFGCGEPIYFAMDAEPYRGETLALTWIDPAGKAREVIRLAVENEAHGWVVQLRLKKSTSLTGFLDGPSAGYENLTGTWTAKLASDKPLWTGRFEVLC